MDVGSLVRVVGWPPCTPAWWFKIRQNVPLLRRVLDSRHRQGGCGAGYHKDGSILHCWWTPTHYRTHLRTDCFLLHLFIYPSHTRVQRCRSIEMDLVIIGPPKNHELGWTPSVRLPSVHSGRSPSLLGKSTSLTHLYTLLSSRPLMP